MKIQYLILVLASLFSTSAMAMDASARTENNFGIYGDIAGDPFPGLWGANLAFNIADFIRLNGGYGTWSLSSTGGGGTETLNSTSYGAGLKLFIPGWDFSPTVGINYSNLTVNITGTGNSLDVAGLTGNANVLYTTIGLDWQTHFGLEIGAGYDIMISPTSGGLPYFNLGWFFKL